MVFYQGYDTSFDSKYKLAGYKIATTTNPTVVNQLEEFGTKLNEGVKNIEIGSIKEDTFESIPKQHLQDIKQLSKLTGAGVSLHAPLIDPTGFPSREGAEPRWSQQQRIANEQQIKTIIERAHDLEKNGNIPVVLHGGTTFSQEYEKGLVDAEGISTPRSMAIVNQDDGKVSVLNFEEKIPLGATKEDVDAKRIKPEIWDPYTRLHSLNQTEWDKEKLELLGQQKISAELRDRMMLVTKQLEPLQYGKERNILTTQEELEYMNLQKQANSINSHVDEIDRHTIAGIKELHNKFEKYKDPKLEEHKKYTKIFPQIQNEFNAYRNELEKIYNELKKEDSKEVKDQEKLNKLIARFHETQKAQHKVLMNHLAEIPAPNLWTPVKDFAVENASTTIANVAFHGFKKFGEKAPILAVENSYPSMPLATAEELRKAIELAREKLQDHIVKEKKVSKEEAKRISEKLIGATWDTAHINMLRKAGYEDEELKKKILEETKKISPLIKHLHISDNFGFSDVHLPPGMGNVPIKELLEELEKREGKRMEEIKHVVEAGGFINAFKQNPFLYTLEYFESPIYKMGAGPYWQQDIQGFYMTPYIEFQPVHLDIYGSKFSTLPTELGGQVAGEKGRFMEGEKEQYQ